MRWIAALALAAAVLAAGVPPSARAQDAAAPKEDEKRKDLFIELTPESQASIERALQWLAKAQKENGSWGSQYGDNVGVNALVLLSFVACGHVPEQGRYAGVLDKGLNWILKQVQPSGLIHNGDGSCHGPMYEHAAATLMLSELYGMSERQEIAATIQAAVRVIVNSQNREGGWRYQPMRRDADVSVTVMAILALRAAQHAGMRVPAATIEQAIKYVKRCSVREGGFQYQAGAGGPNYARTGAGVASLEVCGEYDCEEVRKGLDYLIANIGEDVQTEHYHYGVYYSAQAVYQARDPRRWRQWFPRMREQILSQQKRQGHWIAQQGPAYGTAMMVLTLSIPYRYLPIYQR